MEKYWYYLGLLLRETGQTAVNNQQKCITLPVILC